MLYFFISLINTDNPFVELHISYPDINAFPIPITFSPLIITSSPGLISELANLIPGERIEFFGSNLFIYMKKYEYKI